MTEPLPGKVDLNKCLDRAHKRYANVVKEMDRYHQADMVMTVLEVLYDITVLSDPPSLEFTLKVVDRVNRKQQEFEDE